ncbi:SAGA complex subunit Sgf73 [Recurvomyces mirabilis]|nr:SAGA complex subunit Sgf73 [Recurvomyces mirabilis]
MAGATGRKAPKQTKTDNMASNRALGLDNLFDDLEDVTPVLRDDVRKGLPVIEKPGHWDSKITVPKPDDKENETSSPSMPTKLPGSIARAFPNGKLLGDRPEVLKCTHCKRPVLKHAMPAHIERCLNKKQEKQRKKKEAKDARDAAARKEKSQGDSDGEDDEEGGKKTASKGGMTSSKKRKAIDEGDDGGPNKKKKKKELEKTKTARPKAPVDVEKQCGVELPQGGQCARSLTCKSHSMGAKRSVPGRSAPYDKLLMEYQRRNAAKEAKAKIDASAPNPDDDESQNGPVDIEEETNAVMAGIARGWGGAPLHEAPRVSLKHRYEHNRIRNALDSALGDRRIGIFGGGGVNSNTGISFFTGLPRQPPEGDRRGSVIPRVAPQASRKPSVAMAT